jgi:hypothetical protein
MSTNKALATVGAVALALSPATVLAHTNSIGYVGDGNGGVTFWYGSYHTGTTFNEADIKLEGINGTNYTTTITPFTILSNTTPAGLVPGTNYFTTNGTSLIPYSDATAAGMASGVWQGVTFSGLSAGDYRFTYIPLGDAQSSCPTCTPTMEWAPWDQVIRTNTITLSSAILSGDADGDGINDATGAPVTPSTPTLVSSAAGSPIVTSSSTTQDRYVFDTAADTRTYYQDTVTTTTTTPTTVDTYSDGSTVTTNGTSTSSTTTTLATVPVWVETRTYDVQRTAYAPSGAAPTVVRTHRYAATENGAQQKVNHHITTGTTTPTIRTVTTTAVYTRVYTDGSPNLVTNDPSVITYETSTSYAETYASRDYFGRIDQLEVMDGVNGVINGLLDHEPITNHKKRFRVFENTRFTQSYNADGYTADGRILGGGFEYDLTKGWTAGAQYNQININLNGVDSFTRSTRQHVGVFNSFHGRDLALVTNAGASQDNYNYNRTVEGIFHNAGETTGQQWWVHNRLYVNNSGWFKPFVGYTVSNSRRNAYDETGNAISARSVEASNQTSHVGEAGVKIETRFGGKKHDVFGISVDGSYGTDNSYGVTGSLDYKEVLFVEGSYGVADGVTTNSIAGKVKFRF